jgi:hypothetical protein
MYEQERKMKGMLSTDQEDGLNRMEAAMKEKGKPFDRTIFEPQEKPVWPPPQERPNN